MCLLFIQSLQNKDKQEVQQRKAGNTVWCLHESVNMLNQICQINIHADTRMLTEGEENKH